MPYTIKRFDESLLSFLPRPEEPFEIIGKLVPTYDGHEWQSSEILYDTTYEKTYPDDVFDPKIYIDNPNEAAFLAMFNGNCIGSLRVGKRWNNNSFIDDLAIDRAHRRQGVGTMLMDAAVQWSKEMVSTDYLLKHKMEIYVPAVSI